MSQVQNGSRLRLRLETNECVLRPSEIKIMEGSIAQLSDALSRLRSSNLMTTISYCSRSHEYHVRMSVVLPGRFLVAGEHDSIVLPAYECCLRKLTRKVETFTRQLGGHRASTRSLPVGAAAGDTPDEKRLLQAVTDADYEAFQREVSVLRGPLRRRIMQWAVRFAQCELRNDGLPMDDLLDEVLLTAFEQYESRPPVMLLLDWLAGLIGPSLRSLLRHPDEEREGVGYSRTLREMEQPHALEVPSPQFKGSGTFQIGRKMEVGQPKPLPPQRGHNARDAHDMRKPR